jgi:hypothetical protein
MKKTEVAKKTVTAAEKTKTAAKKTVAKDVPFYSFRIELKRMVPKIWRDFYVPSDMSLPSFHRVIQDVMGWESDHLYSFDIFGEEYFDEDINPFMSSEAGNSWLKKIKLNKLSLFKGSKFTYLYDMGDSWEHAIKVLNTSYVPATPGQKCGCFDGARACPPEDCGGVGGYVYLLEILADPDHPEHEDRMEWIGGPIDPEEFDIEKINKRLRGR